MVPSGSHRVSGRARTPADDRVLAANAALMLPMSETITPTAAALRALAASLRADAEHLERLAEHLEAGSAGPAHRGPATHLSVDEAAAALGVGRSRVYELLAERRLASIRLGRRRWVTSASVDELLAAELSRAV